MRFDLSRLPRAGGRPSTIPLLLPELRGHLPALTEQDLQEAVVRTWQQARQAGDHVEIPSEQRFAWALDWLGCPDEAGALAAQLSRLHAEAVCGAAILEPAQRDALARLGEGRTLVLVSNFDHGPAARGLLQDLGVTKAFERILISAEVGLRKPHQGIFQAALGGLEGEALMVGDDLKADIAGAQALGLDTAWIQRPGKALKEGSPAPTLIARDLVHLAEQLQSR